MKLFKKFLKRGLRLRFLNYLLAVITFVVSCTLLTVAQQTSDSYKSMRKTSENYIYRQQSTYDLQIASDYLTEQVRSFVSTGKVEYLNNYFEEAKVNRRREKALDILKQDFSGTPAYTSLNAALSESVKLMNREYYAMRLTISAYAYDISLFPEEIQSVKLSESDIALSNSAKAALAQSLVFDEAYHEQKEAISNNMQLCLQELLNASEMEQNRASDQLKDLIRRQRILIIISIIIVLCIVTLNSRLVIAPLLDAVSRIRTQQTIPLKGSYEFRFLARTYNMMFQSNQERKQELIHAATHDKLTGLYNRSRYDFLLQNMELDTIALLLIDVDRFKNINDTLGHDMGDVMIVMVASTLREVFCPAGYVCRIGGDEFAVILPDTNATQTDAILDKVRLVNDRLAHPTGNQPQVSISAGVAFGNKRHTPASIFKAADTALYKAKNSGRHICEFSH
ncbi:MAG: GGDEF domain-containing protein [Lachnospiraceae bacterium]|nr:GGDEF domain-containing protein [Lachnospiraceae bacterium]